MRTSHQAAIALGSNLPERLVHLRSGLRALNDLPGTQCTSESSIYESPALVRGNTRAAPDYLNAVALVRTRLSVETLLRECLRIETENGRIRSPERKWESRTLDMDILTYDDFSQQMERLSVPHPRLAERRFVLEPFAEIAASLVIPAPFDATVQYLLDRCPDRTPITIVRPRPVIVSNV